MSRPWYQNCLGCAYWKGDMTCHTCINNPFSMSGTRENKWIWNGISESFKNQEHHVRVPMELDIEEDNNSSHHEGEH